METQAKTAPQVIRKVTPIAMFVADHEYSVVEDAEQRGAFKVVYRRAMTGSFCGEPRTYWTTVRTVVKGLDRAAAENIAAELNKAEW